MVILSFAEPAAVEFASALAAGMAVEMRPGQPMRLITSGEHATELDALGDRIFDALEYGGPGSPDSIPGPQHFKGSLPEQETTQCQTSEQCSSATISPDGTMAGLLPRPMTA